MWSSHTLYMRIWRKENPDYYKTKKWKKYKRDWMRNKRKDKKYYNKELSKNNSWKRINRTKMNDYRKRYDNNRRKTDINFKLVCYLRSTISGAVRCNHISTIKLLGCSIQKLKQHLESQFKKRMSWKNYGKWHIDHIKPCCSFDLSKLKEQKKCFHYTNLQPLWAKENLRKNRFLRGDVE